MQEQAARYDLFTGTKFNNTLEQKCIVGFAFIEDESRYYKIRLMPLPGTIYYLTKNNSSQNKYTLFSKLINKDGRLTFLNPVGSGVLDSSFYDYLEIKIPFFKAQLFMSLYPSKPHFKENQNNE